MKVIVKTLIWPAFCQTDSFYLKEDIYICVCVCVEFTLSHAYWVTAQVKDPSYPHCTSSVNPASHTWPMYAPLLSVCVDMPAECLQVFVEGWFSICLTKIEQHFRKKARCHFGVQSLNWLACLIVTSVRMDASFCWEFLFLFYINDDFIT